MSGEPICFERGLRWYCVRTQPKKERLAAGQLGALFGLETLAPRVRFKRKTVRGVVWFEEALFPGYIFVRFDMEGHKRAVSFAPGVLHVPVFGGRFASLREETIESLRGEWDEGACLDAMEPLAVGDETRILAGSMEGISVRVVRVMPAEQRVAVLLELLGQEVETVLPLEVLEQRRQGALT
mgnify:FL=1